jgi:ribosomal protein S18 acetylase RimI-like enzyme
MTVSRNAFEIRESDQDDAVMSDAQVMSENLRVYIEKKFGPANKQNYVAVIRNKETGEVVAGLKGYSHWRWLYIHQLWVAESVRSQGFGSELLKLAEVEAKKRQDLGLYVDTFEEKTRDFYSLNGFVEVGKIPNFPAGGCRFFLSKPIR